MNINEHHPEDMHEEDFISLEGEYSEESSAKVESHCLQDDPDNWGDDSECGEFDYNEENDTPLDFNRY